MRLAILALVTVPVLGAMAAPASAQLRDPFDPLISPQSSAPSDASGQATPAGAADDTTAATETTSSERMPTTGTEVATWGALAYVLIATGAAALALSRLRRPRCNAARA